MTRHARLGAFVLLAVFVVASSALAAGSQRSGGEATFDGREAQKPTLAQTQRSIRESLAAASLTPVQVGEAYSFVDAFVRNYTRALQQGEQDFEGRSFNEIFDGKVGARFSQRYALNDAELTALRARTADWLDHAMITVSTPDRPRLVGGER